MIARRTALRRLGAAAAALAASPVCGVALAESYTLRMNLNQPADSAHGLGSVRFATAIARRTNGQVKVEVYPNGQLASQAGAIDQLATGVIDFSMQSPGFLEPLFPQYQVFDLPFLFRDAGRAFRVLDGPIGVEFFGPLESKGIVGLSWGFGGFKELGTAAKAVVTPDDVKGLRIRIQSGAIFNATYRALGAIPVTLDVAEIFTGLSQHTIDGMDNTLDTITSGKFYTVIKHIAITNHGFAIDVILGSKRRLEALPPALQRIIKEEGKAVSPYWREASQGKVAENLQTLRNNGVAITSTQYAAFRKAVEPVYAMLQAKIGGDLIERVSRAAGTA